MGLLGGPHSTGVSGLGVLGVLLIKAQVIALMTGEGDVETPPHERVGGVESCEMRESTAELQVVLCWFPPVTRLKDIVLRPSVSDLAAGFPLPGMAVLPILGTLLRFTCWLCNALGGRSSLS